MNPLRPIWTFWEEWCDEDAPELAKKLGFIALLGIPLTLFGITGHQLITGEKPAWMGYLLFFPFLVMTGCCWHVGRKAWAVGYIGLVVILATGMWLQQH